MIRIPSTPIVIGALCLLSPEVTAAPPAISSFTVSATGIRRGDEVTLQWDVADAEAITISPQLGAVTGSSQTISAQGTTVFTLSATNADGTSTARVKIYDRDQASFFTDTVLATTTLSYNLGRVTEFAWDGTILKEIPVPSPNPLHNLGLHDTALDGDGRLLVSATIHAISSISAGLMDRDPATGHWTYHPVPDLYLGDVAAGDLTVAGATAYFGAHRIRLTDFEATRLTTGPTETNIAADGFVHAGASGSSAVTSLKYYDPITGADAGAFSLEGVIYPVGESFAPDVRSIDVTADGERFISSWEGFIYRLSGQPAMLGGFLAVKRPGSSFRSPTLDVQVAPDGRLVAGMRTTPQDGTWVLLTDRAFQSPRYLKLVSEDFETYTAFTFSGLTKPRVDYFRATDTSVAAGHPVELCWQVAGARTVSIEGVGEKLPAEGSAVVTLAASRSFALSAKNAWGQVSQALTVFAGQPPLIDAFTASPMVVPLGQPTSLAWSVRGSDRVRLSPALGWQFSESGHQSVPILQDTTYVLTAENETGKSRAEVRVIAGPPVGPSASAEVISMGAPWSWLHPLNNIDPLVTDLDFHSTWMRPWLYNGPAFHDPAAAMLGYGQLDWGALATDIGIPPSGSRHTAYFRRSFDLPEGSGPCTLDTRIDDGAVFYIDGIEKGRVNYLGPDTYRGLAPTFSNEGSITSVALGTLSPGTHWIGVSVHNSSNDSTDLGFDLRLTSTLPWHGLPADPAGRRDVSFTEADVGAASYTAGTNGTADAGWHLVTGNAGAVIDLGGRVFHVSSGPVRLVTDPIDLRGTIDESAHIDVRVFENGPADGFEAADTIEVWVEGSTDGVTYSRIATVIPLRHGGRELTPPNDEFAPWNGGENGSLIRFVTPPGALPPEVTSARLVINATNDEPTEHFIFDNAGIAGTPSSADADADGLSDVWEMSHFSSLAAAAADDPDGDGQPNRAEQAAGTNPLQSSSRLAITMFSAPTATLPGHITWTSVAGRRYDVQQSDDLVQWSPLDTGVPGEGASTDWEIPPGPAPSAKAYRISLAH